MSLTHIPTDIRRRSVSFTQSIHREVCPDASSHAKSRMSHISPIISEVRVHGNIYEVEINTTSMTCTIPLEALMSVAVIITLSLKYDICRKLALRTAWKGTVAETVLFTYHKSVLYPMTWRAHFDILGAGNDDAP